MLPIPFCPENVVCFLRLLHLAAYILIRFRLLLIMEANTADQTSPWVHIVCNIGYLSTYADERADGNCFEWPENYTFIHKYSEHWPVCLYFKVVDPK